MTDPDSSAAGTDGEAAAERVARLASSRAQKGPAVEGARILTAGLSGSLLLGLMACMGWADRVATTDAAPPVTAPVVPAAPASATAPVTPPPAATAETAAAEPAATVTAPIDIPVATARPATAPPVVVVPVATTRASD